LGSAAARREAHDRVHDDPLRLADLFPQRDPRSRLLLRRNTHQGERAVVDRAGSVHRGFQSRHHTGLPGLRAHQQAIGLRQQLVESTASGRGVRIGLSEGRETEAGEDSLRGCVDRISRRMTAVTRFASSSRYDLLDERFQLKVLVRLVADRLFATHDVPHLRPPSEASCCREIHRRRLGRRQAEELALPRRLHLLAHARVSLHAVRAHSLETTRPGTTSARTVRPGLKRHNTMRR
jgi:hypothetical protein